MHNEGEFDYLIVEVGAANVNTVNLLHVNVPLVARMLDHVKNGETWPESVQSW
jgi:hypothetical protein